MSPLSLELNVISFTGPVALIDKEFAVSTHHIITSAKTAVLIVIDVAGAKRPYTVAETELLSYGLRAVEYDLPSQQLSGVRNVI